MNVYLTFWAQALDNASADEISVNGNMLHPDDSSGRQKVVTDVSYVVKTGRCEFESVGVKLTANNDQFILEVIPTEMDREGRAAPIVCLGDYNSTILDGLGNSVAVGLEDFANRIGRHLTLKQTELVHNAFCKLKHSSMIKRRRQRGIIIVAFIALILLFYFLLADTCM